MDKTLELLLDRLPPFIQKGNKFCKLIIHKQGSDYVIKYTNATDDLHDHNKDLTKLTSVILKKLEDLRDSGKYKI